MLVLREKNLLSVQHTALVRSLKQLVAAVAGGGASAAAEGVDIISQVTAMILLLRSHETALKLPEAIHLLCQCLGFSLSSREHFLRQKLDFMIHP
jgi:hypothetical protein